MILLLLVIFPIAFVMEVVFLKWLTATLTDVGYLPHALSTGDAIQVAIVLTVSAVVAGILKALVELVS